MTDEERENYKQAIEKNIRLRQEQENIRKKTAIKRCKEGNAYPDDWQYYYDGKGSINEKKDKIAHPDTMRKTPATILLIVGMIGSLIFKQWYFAWIILLWWYFSKDRV